MKILPALAALLAVVSSPLAVSGQEANPAFLGLIGSPVPEALRDHVKALRDFPGGILLDNLVPGGPAAQGGLKKNDILIRFNDQALINFEQLHALVNAAKPGDQVTLTYCREGEVKEAKVTLGDGKALVDPGSVDLSGLEPAPKFGFQTTPGADQPRLMSPEELERKMKEHQKAIDAADKAMEEQHRGLTEENFELEKTLEDKFKEVSEALEQLGLYDDAQLDSIRETLRGTEAKEDAKPAPQAKEKQGEEKGGATSAAKSEVRVQKMSSSVSVLPSQGSAAQSFSWSQQDDQGSVTYNGKEVWTGKVAGSLHAKSKIVDGKGICAAFDGDKVIWESEPGAGEALR